MAALTFVVILSITSSLSATTRIHTLEHSPSTTMDTFSIAPAVPVESPEGVFVDSERGNSGHVTAQCVIVW